MYLTKVLALVALFSSTAFADPAAVADANPPTKPNKPPKPQSTIVSQSNACGNGVAPYCCNMDNWGQFTSCSAVCQSSRSFQQPLARPVYWPSTLV